MPRSERLRPIALLCTVVLGVAALLGACSGSDDTVSGGGLTVRGLDTEETIPRDRVDDLAFTDFDGTEGTFGDLVGKPMVVNFWASWCVPCIKEMPAFEAVHQELGDRVTFIGVNVVDQPSDAARMVEQTGVTYKLVRDPKRTLLAWFGGTQMPTTAFVDSTGRVVAVLTESLTADELRREIEKLR